MAAEHFVSQIFLPISLVLMMLGLGATLDWQGLRAVFVQPKALLVGAVGQMVLLPAVAFLLAWVLPLPGYIAAGLIIIACAPGGITSNVVSFALGGNTALSISLTAISTILCVFTIPLLVGLGLTLFWPDGAGNLVLPFWETLVRLFLMTLLPVGIGISLHYVWPRVAQKVAFVAGRAALPFLVVIMALVVIGEFGFFVSNLPSLGLPILAFALLMGALGLSLGRLAGLVQRDRRTLMIEIGLQNTTLALLVALTLLNEPKLTLVPGCYGLLMFIAVGVLMLWPRRKLAGDTK